MYNLRTSRLHGLNHQFTCASSKGELRQKHLIPPQGPNARLHTGVYYFNCKIYCLEIEKCKIAGIVGYNDAPMICPTPSGLSTAPCSSNT